MHTFTTEQSLVDHFIECLSGDASPWGELRYAREFFYQRGRTDVVAVTGSGHLIAFEAKLSRWRTALHQAYRNLCFAHRSYVVLPKKAAQLAGRYQGAFERRGVGLCYVDASQVVVVYDAEPVEPLQPWLSDAAAAILSGEANDGCRA